MIEKILHLSGFAAYAIIFALPALEASVFLGFIFPGEIAVLLGGVIASQGRIGIGWVIVVAFAGAVIGDSVGYEVGKRFGPRLLDGPLRRFVKPDHRQRASAFIRRHGGKAVFLGRFLAAMRVLVPGFAGMADMPYRTFLIFNVLGGAVWAIAVAFVGYAAGTGYKRVQHFMGRASLILLVIVVLIVGVAMIARRIARNPDPYRQWWARQRRRPGIRQVAALSSFLIARFKPGQAFGLGLTLGAVTVVAVGIAFGTILHDVASRQNLFHVDTPALRWMVRHEARDFTTWMRAVSILGSTAFISFATVITAAALAVRKRTGWAILVTASSFGALALENLIKIIVARPRPNVAPLAHATGYSFPSGHATLAIAFYGALAVVAVRALRRWAPTVSSWTGALVLACLIGFSRIYLRVHYLTDVLGGLALGAAWLTVVGTTEGAWGRRSAVARDTPGVQSVMATPEEGSESPPAS